MSETVPERSNIIEFPGTYKPPILPPDPAHLVPGVGTTLRASDGIPATGNSPIVPIPIELIQQVQSQMNMILLLHGKVLMLTEFIAELLAKNNMQMSLERLKASGISEVPKDE